MKRVFAAGLFALFLALGLGVWTGCPAAEEPQRDEGGSSDSLPLRLISLNPSLSAIVIALDRAETLVGIDDYSARILPELGDRPRVGGLFDPSLEAVVWLQPDRILVVAGVDQKTHAERLERLGLQVEIYQNERLDEVLENIDRLGRLLDREELASERIASIRDMRAAVAKATEGRVKPGALAIVDRSPLYLVGRNTFLDEMLVTAGADNLARDLAEGYPRSSTEWLIAAGPELLLDMTPGAASAAEFWARWPSLPAVASGRALTIEASAMTMPGPHLDSSLRDLAAIVHGKTILAAIDSEYAALVAARTGKGNLQMPAKADAKTRATRAESGAM